MAKPQTVHRLELVPPQRRGPGRPGGQRQVVDVTLRTSDRMLLSVEEAADRLGIGRTTMWMLIRRGEIASIHVGQLRRIEPEALAAYIASDASRTLTQPPDASWSV
jgi:excisionase family DNA binding protein